MVVYMIIALGLGVYVGLGLPGIPGRGDRVVARARRRKVQYTPLDWFRPRRSRDVGR
jgi:hypothetical protein